MAGRQRRLPIATLLCATALDAYVTIAAGYPDAPVRRGSGGFSGPLTAARFFNV